MNSLSFYSSFQPDTAGQSQQGALWVLRFPAWTEELWIGVESEGEGEGQDQEELRF